MMGMPSCRDVAERLSREQDEAAPGRRTLALRIHLLMCGYCRRYGRQLAWLRINLHRALACAANARLSPEARERIRARLEQDSNGPGDV